MADFLAKATEALSATNYLEAAKAARKAQDEFSNVKNVDGACQALIVGVQANMLQGKARAAVRVAEQAAAAFLSQGSKKGQATALHVLMNANIAADKFADAAKVSERACAAFQEIGDVSGEAATLQVISRAYLAKENYVEAVKAATKAIALFRSLGKGESELAALDTVVLAYVGMETPKDAMRDAAQVLSSFRSAGDAKNEALAMHQMVKIHVGEKSYKQAVSLAKDALDVVRPLGDKKLEAQMALELAKLQAMAGEFDKAKATAEEATNVSKVLGDWAGHREVLNVLQDVKDAQHFQKESAVKKHVELEILKDLAAALEERDAEKFKDLHEQLAGFEAVTQEDADRILQPVINQDPEACMEFLMDNSTGDDEKVPLNFKFFEHNTMYFYFTMGGMCYGPGFRLCRTMCRKGQPGYNDTQGIGVLRCRSMEDDWAKKMHYHPGIFDCALQAGSIAT